MFADQLRAARQDAGLTIGELADRSGLTTAALIDYELGVRRPRTDTAERILESFGHVLVAVATPRLPPKWRPQLDPAALRHLEKWSMQPLRAVSEAARMLPTILEAHAAAERLELSWGQLRVVADERTVAGDPLDVHRVQLLAEAAREAIRTAEKGQSVRLQSIAPGGFVTVDPSLKPVHRALDFLARAIETGADPTLTLFQVNAALLIEGIPWLVPPYKQIPDYRRALAACIEVGDARPLVRVLADSVNERRFAE
jgi:transcriptional regulator with XRE-family HTH domain